MTLQNDNTAGLFQPDPQGVRFSDSDLLIKAKVQRSEIQLLAKFVEGLGHLGVVTTIDRMTGEVLIQTTKYCWPDLKEILNKLPITIELEKES